jgi:hypothetical protein
MTATRRSPGDRMTCPAGKELKPLPKPEDGAIRYKATMADCGACALKTRCTTARARTVLRLINEPALERVARRLKAEPTLMNKRAQSVEPAFGTLKCWLPILPFERRGGRFLLRGRCQAGANFPGVGKGLRRSGGWCGGKGVWPPGNTADFRLMITLQRK